MNKIKEFFTSVFGVINKIISVILKEKCKREK